MVSLNFATRDDQSQYSPLLNGRIDNNEMAGMVDGASMFRGELGMWNARVPHMANNVEKRLGWGLGETCVGSVGKAINTMGMARVRTLSSQSSRRSLVLTQTSLQATYEAVLTARPNDRPVIVSRSGLPGIQAYAHAVSPRDYQSCLVSDILADASLHSRGAATTRRLGKRSNGEPR